MLEIFNNIPIFNAVTLTVALIGIILTIYFAIRARKVKKPVYAVRTINLVKDKLGKIDRVEMLFDGRRIENLSISKFVLWNEGKETIRAADIAPRDPLRIMIDPEYRILDCKIIAERNRANGFVATVAEDGLSICITFDYFDRQEGAVLEIAHTGTDSSCLTLMGSLHGVRKFGVKTAQKPVFPRFNIKLDRLIRMAVGWMFLIGSLGALALMFTGAVITEQKFNPFDALMLGIIYFFAGFLILPRRTAPKGLNVFNEEF